MKNKKNKNTDKNNKISNFFTSVFEFLKENKIFVSSCVCSFLLLSIVTYFFLLNTQNFSTIDLSDFEVGRVAERSVFANRDVKYVDEEATAIRFEAKKHLVIPVFRKDLDVKSKVVNDIAEFINVLEDRFNSSESVSDFVFLVQEMYPKQVVKEELVRLYSGALHENAKLALSLSKQIMDQGVIEYPADIADYNNNQVRLITLDNGKQKFANVPLDSLLRINDLKSNVEATLKKVKAENSLDDVLAIITPFIKPNIFYDSNETTRALEAALKEVEPVAVTINKNQSIVKQGFIVSEENVKQLKVLADQGRYIDTRYFLSIIIYFVVIFITAIFLFSESVILEKLSLKNKLILLSIINVVYLFTLFSTQIRFVTEDLDLIPFVIIGATAMLTTILISQKIAILATFVLALTIFGATGFNFPIFLYSLFSGLAGTAFIRQTGHRMDLIKTACILTFTNPILTLVLVLMFPNAVSDRIFILTGSAINGFLTGIFVLGFLPIMETGLNIPTRFRLMELSDLNAPLMQKMHLSVPGTYNHSIMVASLAEIACRDIGINSLLARVGAYYHDIGKMENPEYFIENQKGYNKHIELNPRLSATVIRSHVKLGVEKARQMRLPEEVIDIISEHHGNDVIEYFYNQALKENPNVDKEDFSYPGVPPRTKESAVVLLADTVEAACRAMSDHSHSALEKRIEELVQKKLDKGLLDNSNLTLSEIKTVKASFLSILSGYYHSRIEYNNKATPNKTTSDKKKPTTVENGLNEKNKAVNEITK